LQEIEGKFIALQKGCGIIDKRLGIVLFSFNDANEILLNTNEDFLIIS